CYVFSLSSLCVLCGSIFLHSQRLASSFLPCNGEKCAAAARSRVLAIFVSIQRQLSRFLPRNFRNSAAAFPVPACQVGCDIPKSANSARFQNSQTFKERTLPFSSA